MKHELLFALEQKTYKKRIVVVVLKKAKAAKLSWRFTVPVGRFHSRLRSWLQGALTHFAQDISRQARIESPPVEPSAQKRLSAPTEWVAIE